MDIAVYRLVTVPDAAGKGSYLIATKILEPGMKGEPNIRFALVDTKEAATMLRDVSLGPSPFFGALLEESVKSEVDINVDKR